MATACTVAVETVNQAEGYPDAGMTVENRDDRYSASLESTH